MLGGGIEPNAIRRLQASERRILGRNFKTKLLTFSVFSCFLPPVFIQLSIQHNLTLKRKKQENTEKGRSLVLKFLPKILLCLTGICKRLSNSVCPQVRRCEISKLGSDRRLHKWKNNLSVIRVEPGWTRRNSCELNRCFCRPDVCSWSFVEYYIDFLIDFFAYGIPWLMHLLTLHFSDVIYLLTIERERRFCPTIGN